MAEKKLCQEIHCMTRPQLSNLNHLTWLQVNEVVREVRGGSKAHVVASLSCPNQSFCYCAGWVRNMQAQLSSVGYCNGAFRP